MSQLRIYTKRDKAAFLNKCKSLGIALATTQIQSGKTKNRSYFDVDIDPKQAQTIRDAFRHDDSFDVLQLREVLKRIIREELGETKK